MPPILLPLEAADPFCLNEGEAAQLLRGHPWRRFVVIGDSVASGVGDAVPGYSELPWCSRLAAELAALQPGLEYLNLGVRELRAAEVLATQLDRALAFGPDLALVSAGGNDAMRSSYRPDELDATLTKLIHPLRDAGADVITVGIFDVSHAPAIPMKVKPVVSQRMQELSRRAAALAVQLGTIHANCTNHPAQQDPASYSSDGIHGNLRAHAISAAITVRRLGEYLGTA